MSESRPPDRRRWFRFSLRSLLAATVIFLLGVSHWNTSLELKTTRDALVKLRRETGELVIRDPAKLQVVSQRPTMLGWKSLQWRIYVPPRSSYRLAMELNDIAPVYPNGPAHVVLPMNREILLPPGEHTILCEISDHGSEPDNDEFDVAIQILSPKYSNGAKWGMQVSDVPWMTSDWDRHFRVVGMERTELFEVDQTVDLLNMLALPRTPGQIPHWDGIDPPNSSKIKVRLTPVAPKP